MAKESLRKLSPEETVGLREARERIEGLLIALKGSDQNIKYFKDFLDEARAHIDSKPEESIKKDWTSRLKNCKEIQIPEEERKRTVNSSLLEKARKSYDSEKAKHKGLVEKDGEYFVPA